ncbi:transporter substrate-binding domain-containing protein [Paraglaciecola aquimarina]|uniref:Transporter substrate-binding domain-containing protein n=1 Tax=Paraglaciecola algarum TaxID=3050085 RepID=A0ABS9DD21_9ALTE|nr:transporter substrate-binding domain-containing protein [Paraglaciecola sp. G1-23]
MEITDTIHLTNGEWPPFYSKNLPHYGLDSQIVAESFALVGVKVKYEFFPWARAYKFSEDNRWHGTVGWPLNKQHKDTHFYSNQPINTGNWVLFHRIDKPIFWENINDLKGLIFGVTIGDWVLDGENELVNNLKAQELTYIRVVSDESNFKMLLKGRIDIFPQQREVGIAQMRKLFNSKQREQLTFHPKSFQNMPLYLLLNKKNKNNKRYMDLYNKGFQKLQDSGRYQELLTSFAKQSN